MPTAIDIMGQAVPAVDGHSLLPALRDNALKGRDFVVSASPFPRQEKRTPDITVTTDEWSLLYYPEPGQSWLYHLPSDPGQEKNVISEHPEIARELHQLLVKFMRDHNVAPNLIEERSELKL